MGRELYVGNMSFQATGDDLRNLFAVAGTVSTVHVITDPMNGKSKGCGYVKMATEAEAKEAINSLDGALLIDRVITVSEARPQKPNLKTSADPRRKPGQRPAAGRGRKIP